MVQSMPSRTRQQPVRFSARIERKQPELPRFVVVPASRVAAWTLTQTTPVEVVIDGQPVARRTIKQWDAARWFLSITAADCRRLGADTGDRIRIVLRVASPRLPRELAGLLRTVPRARSVWSRLTSSQQRMLAENIRAAKQAETRDRRARRALLA